MNYRISGTKQKKVLCKGLMLLLTCFAAPLAADLQSEDSRKITKPGVSCPCAFDEPFASVLIQINNRPHAWKFSRVDPHHAVRAGSWQSYRLLHRDQKRHTLRLKLTENRDSSHLFCSWIQWSDDGSIDNKIGMGHHLFKDLIEAGRAKKACLTQITDRLRHTATSVESLLTGRLSSLSD